MSSAPRGGGLKILGIGALACLGCCAGPVLAFLGGLSIAGLASATVIGAAGLIIAAGAFIAYLLVRRGRSSTCAAKEDQPVAVAAPTRKGACA